MTTLEILFLVIIYLLWGVLQTKHMYRQKWYVEGQEPEAFFSTIFWPLVYIFRTLFSED